MGSKLSKGRKAGKALATAEVAEEVVQAKVKSPGKKLTRRRSDKTARRDKKKRKRLSPIPGSENGQLRDPEEVAHDAPEEPETGIIEEIARDASTEVQNLNRNESVKTQLTHAALKEAEKIYQEYEHGNRRRHDIREDLAHDAMSGVGTYYGRHGDGSMAGHDRNGWQGMGHELMKDAARGGATFHDEQHDGHPSGPDDLRYMIRTGVNFTDVLCHLVGPGQLFMGMSRNKRYKRNGFKDYARAINRHRIQPRQHNPIFFDPKTHTLCRRDAGQKHAPSGQKYEDPGMSGGGLVSANDVQNDSEYACPVIIGTPGIKLDLDFDTGSSDLWVWSTESRATREQKQRHDCYDPRRSHTSKQIKGLTWEIGYADGSHASGDVHQDVVDIGGVRIPNQSVEVAQDMSQEFLTSNSDGLLGLAFHKLNTVSTKQKTPMENMVEQGLIKDPIFTVKLDKGDSDGYYTFGYMEKPAKSSQIYWTRITPQNGYWEFRSGYMKFGDQIYNRVNNTAILDTGTTLILLHDTFVHLIYSAIPGAYLSSDSGGYIFPTNTEIPPLSFCIGDYLFTIPGSDLAFSDAGNGMSFGAVQSRGGNPQDILGDVLLKHIYAVFDQGSPPRLGVAQRT